MLEHQLAADCDQWTTAPDPAAVESRIALQSIVMRVRIFEGLMIDRIANTDDLALYGHRVRHCHIADEKISNGLRDDRLAVSGRTVDEQRMSRGDRRSQLIQHVVAEHEM